MIPHGRERPECVTRLFASIVRFPDRHGPIPPGSFRGRSTRFAAAMARVRRPVPFRTRKLRPCTAMVLHPRGCGRVARRRFHTIRFPPVEPPRAPGGILVFFPHARARGPDGGADGQGKAGKAPQRRPCAVSVMDRRRGYAVHTSSERMTECI